MNTYWIFHAYNRPLYGNPMRFVNLPDMQKESRPKRRLSQKE